MDQDSRKIRKNSAGIPFDTLHVKDIIRKESGNRLYRNLDSIQKEMQDYLEQSQQPERATASFTYKLIFQILESFFDKLLEKVIIDNCIFVFPWEAAYIFVAQRPLKSKSYRYSTITGTGYYAIYFVFPFKRKWFRKRILLQLKGKWRKRFIQEIQAGHKYDRYELIINKIKARHA